MLRAIEVKALPNFRLYLRFEDGMKGEVDLSHLAGKGVFAAWNEAGFFSKVHIGSRGQIQWSDEIDLCPDALYCEITGKSPESALRNASKARSNA